MPFVYIKVPTARHAGARDQALEFGIAQALAERHLGSVVSSGSSLGDAGADGSRRVAFHRIDVDVNDVGLARSLFQQLLPALGAPAFTEVHYSENRRAMQDVFASSGWTSGSATPASRR